MLAFILTLIAEAATAAQEYNNNYDYPKTTVIVTIVAASLSKEIEAHINTSPHNILCQHGIWVMKMGRLSHKNKIVFLLNKTPH